MIPPRYLPTVRQNEVALACECAKRGESLCFVGMAGVGKSNIVRILRYSSEIKQRYLGEFTRNIHFAVVDGTTWEGTATSLNDLMLAAVEPVMDLLQLNLPPVKTIPLNDAARLRRRLFDSVHLICSQPDIKLVFILDDIDDLIRHGPLAMLESLSAMRNAESREKLSYLVMTKRLPHKLGIQFDELRGSKFYDLFKWNTYALGPYGREDALQMLRHVNALADRPLSRDQLATILWLCGNHARLMRVVFEIWRTATPAKDALGFFSHQGDVRRECRRILNALHPQEVQVARRFVRDQLNPDDEPTVHHLVTRGFVVDVGSRRLFSPLMSAHLLMDE